MACFSKYRHRVEIQAATDSTADDYNQTTQTWASIGSFWAEVLPLTGRQLEWGKTLHEQVSHQITLRHQVGITTDHRIVFSSRTFEVLSVINPEERNVELVLMCVEEVA